MGATDTIDIRHRIKRCPDCGQHYSPDSAFCPFDGQKLVDGFRQKKVDPLLGAVIDQRYQVDDVLGEGGMGTVYAVRHTSLERTFALKALRRDLATDAELCARFIREAKATAAIKHPNVVSITDFGALPDGRPYFVMERLTGQTLAHLVKHGGAVPAARAAAIAVKVARALGAAHEAGVVHRDLKPDNVFLQGRADAGAEQDVRVVDFGAAKVAGASRLTRAGIVFGTPFYMSPEQASGAPVDHRADIYALGVIMYEMFTGRVPFEGDTYMGVLTQHMFAQPTPPSRLDPKYAKELGALEALTLKCLEKAPEKRFATMAELAAEIERVVSVDADGRTTMTPYLEGGEARGEPRIFGIADALELPTTSEIRRRSARDHQPSPRRGAAMVVGSVLGVAALIIGVAWVVRFKARAHEAPVVQAAAPPPSATVAPSSAPPAAPAARRVQLASNVPADVFLGAALVGKTPLELSVEPASGPSTYTVRAAGYDEQQVVVGATTAERIDVALRKSPVPPAARTAPTQTHSSAHAGGFDDPWK